MYSFLLPTALLFCVIRAADVCAVTRNVEFTFFGLGSAGTITRFGCTGTKMTPGSMTTTLENAPHPSGGDGSFEHPALFATAESNPAFTKCEIIYLPYFKKYFQYGDICAQCETDFENGLTHIDLWVGPNPQPDWTDNTIPLALAASGAACQINWGKIVDQTLIQNPPADLEVQLEALDDGKKCYYNDLERYFPNNTDECSRSIGSPTSSDVPVSPSETGSSTKESGESSVQDSFIPYASSIIDGEPTQSEMFPEPSASIPSTAEDSSMVFEKPVTTTPPSQALPNDSSSSQGQDSDKSDETTAGTDKLPEVLISGDQPGDPCPIGGWFSGCVWGSGPGKIGEPCTSKIDCHGDWICVGGRCADNLHNRLTRRERRRVIL